jgi:hypothetical protein
VAIHEIIDGRVQDVGYSTDRFNFGDLALAKDSTAHLGYAGFRVVYPLNRDDKEDEVMSVLGASYFRVIGRARCTVSRHAAWPSIRPCSAAKNSRTSPSSGSSVRRRAKSS